MEKTVRTKLPIGRIVKIEELEDGSYEVVQKVVEVSENEVDDTFILIEAEMLSEYDDFLQYEAKSLGELYAKSLIIRAIRKKVKNFYRPKYDPSLAVDGKGICFAPGKAPAVGELFEWWAVMATRYNPERKSRLGTRLEYGAFLGVLIKKLVEEGKGIEWAWNSVCNNSCALGHYYNSEDVNLLEATGSREICGFCDLSNTRKILVDDRNPDKYYLAGGACVFRSQENPIAHIESIDKGYNASRYGVGWVVLEK